MVLLIRYVMKRVLTLIPVIIAVSFIVYALLELMPGNFVDTLISGEMTVDDVAALRKMYNLDKPMIYRYGLYMFNLVQGDLGLSLKSGMPVFDTYMQKLPNTLILSFSAAALAIAISMPLGIRAARKAGTMTDTATTGFTLIGMSMPPFWLGLLLLLLFSLRLGWLPVGGNTAGIRSLILPAICSAMNFTAICARQTRSSMLDVLNADFLRTARAKGVPEETVIRKHALGNALIPIITTIGGHICMSLAGSAIVEQVFAWPGVGRMLVEGVGARDVTVILGCTTMTTIMYVTVMLIVDLLYAFVDPRIKSLYTRKKQTEKIMAPVPVEPGIPDAAPAFAVSFQISEPQADGYGKPPLQQGRELHGDPGAQFPADVSYGGAQDYVTRQHMSIADGNLSDDVGGIVVKLKKHGKMGNIWHRLVRNKSSLAGMIILGAILIIALISLSISYESITEANVPARFLPPSWENPFGTDHMGRNAFLRVIYGTRYSIIIGFGSVLLSVIVGVTLGSIAGYFGGRTDNIIMRVSDVLASIPGLLLGMVIMVVLGQKLQSLVIAVGVSGITHFIRMSRASILTVKGNEFVEAARAVGFSDLRILATQALPNGLSPIIVMATTSLGLAIMTSAALSYLGFGVPAPTPEWGALISVGRETARTTPWLMTFPGIAIMITILGFNLLGDGLRDALDPKLKR